MSIFAIPRLFSSRSSASSRHPDFHYLQIQSQGTWLPAFTSHFQAEYTIIPLANRNPLPLPLLHLFLCSFAIPRLSFRLHTSDGVCLLELVRDTDSSSISAYLNREDDCCSPPRFRFSCIEELLQHSASLDNSSTNSPHLQEHPSIISLSDHSSSCSSSPPNSSGSDFSSSESSDASFDYTTLANTKDPLVSLDILDDSFSLTIFDTNQVTKAVLVLELHVPIFRDFLSLEKYVPLSFLPSNFDIALSFLSPISSPQSTLQLSVDQVSMGIPKSTQTRIKSFDKRKRETHSEEGGQTTSWPPFSMSEFTFKLGPQLRVYQKPLSVWRPESSLCTLTAEIQTIPLNQEASLFEISCKLTFACESLKFLKLLPSPSQMSSSSPASKLKPRFFILVSESFINQDLSKLAPLRLIGTDPPNSTNVDLQGFRICEFEAGFPFSSCTYSFVFQQVTESGAKAYVPMVLSPLPSLCSLEIERPPFPCEVVVPHTAITDSWIPNNSNQLNVLSYHRKSSSPCVRPFQFQVSKLPSFSSPKFPWPKEYTWISSSTLSIQPSDGGMDVLLSMNIVSSLKPGKELIRIVQPKYSSLSWGMVNGHPKTEHRMVLFESGEVVVFQGRYPTSSVDICWSIKSVYEKCSNFTSIKLSIPTPNVPSLVPTMIHIQSTSYFLAGYIDPNSKRTMLKQPVSVTQLAWNNQTVSDLILCYEIEEQSHDETNVVLPAPSAWQVFCSRSQSLLLMLSCFGILLLLVYQLTLPLEAVTDQASFLTTPLPKNFENHENLRSLQIKLLQAQAFNQKLQEQHQTITKEVHKTVSVTSCTNTEYIASPTKLSSLELEKQQFQNAFGFLRFNKKNNATN
ncbi:Schizosaccharomyces specific protein, DNAJ domain [Schizosaccharomyces osmophilus]|uniref:Schizosaccharomyces specific protein, DNAJ domain n=1 Tax=Schizosaccharomyces osmophilus TaxID=2545709 RepID=A0AAE9WG41_9SCHI|nr:Schizosaccharomyces specific protein, DNAJ domain [Schizosaccharomyces osmophilus]WBW75555.1 Schizosaccharomyces specific protein, DNAJ domain [Schizosaccharomyces osmophilus]